MALDDDEEEVVEGLEALQRIARATAGKLSMRELWAFRAGLHASHAEEALLVGEPVRAKAHLIGLLKFARKLRNPQFLK